MPRTNARWSLSGHLRGLQGAPDRGLADFVLAGQLRHGLASGMPFGNLALLASVESTGTAELLAVGTSPGDAFLAAKEARMGSGWDGAATVSWGVVSGVKTLLAAPVP